MVIYYLMRIYLELHDKNEFGPKCLYDDTRFITFEKLEDLNLFLQQFKFKGTSLDQIMDTFSKKNETTEQLNVVMDKQGGLSYFRNYGTSCNEVYKTDDKELNGQICYANHQGKILGDKQEFASFIDKDLLPN